MNTYQRIRGSIFHRELSSDIFDLVCSHQSRRLCSLLVFLILLSTATNSVAQTGSVQISLRTPLQNVLKLGDLWQVTLTNSSSQAMNIVLQATVSESKKGRVLVATSRSIQLQKGSHQLNGRSVEPVTITESSAGIQDQVSRLGSFPDGDYTICVEVLQAENGNQLARDCINHSVTTALPPILLTPYDQTDVTDNIVVWTWFMQPSVRTGEEIICDLRVVEMLQNQTAEEALRNNPPLIVKTNLRSTAWQTNFATRDFQSGHRYAWRVTARIGKDVISESEIWRFKYADPQQQDSSQVGNKDISKDYVDALKDSTSQVKSTEDVIPQNPKPVRSGPEPLTFNVKSRFTLESSNRPGALSEAPATFARWEIDPKINLFGTPFNLSILLSTEEKAKQSSINRGAFLFRQDTRGLQLNVQQRIDEKVEEINKTKFELLSDTLRKFQTDTTEFNRQIEELNSLNQKDPIDALKELGVLSGAEEFLMNVPSFGFGNVAPQFTDLTMNGVTIAGGMMEYNPNQFYAAAAFGKAQRTIDLQSLPPSPSTQDSALTSPEFFQNVYAGRIGYGRKNGSNIIVSALYSFDDEQTRFLERLLDSTTSILSAQENMLVGLSGRLALDSLNFALDAEFNASLFTDNTNSGIIQNRRALGFVSKIFQEKNVKSNSLVDVSYAVKGSYLLFNRSAKISSGIRMIGPGYHSIGVVGLRTDIFRYDAQYEHNFLERQLVISSLYGYEKTGFVLSESNTSTIQKFGASTELRLRNYPVLQVAYTFNNQKQTTAASTENRSTTSDQLTFGSRYNTRVGSLRSGTVATYSLQKQRADDGKTDFTSNAVQVSQRISFAIPFSAMISLGYTKTKTAVDSIEQKGVLSTDISFIYDVFDIWQNNAGLSFNSNQQSKSRGAFITSRVNVQNYLSIEARVEYNEFTDLLNQGKNFSERIARLIITLQL